MHGMALEDVETLAELGQGALELLILFVELPPLILEACDGV